jgi:hypothetical protein
MRSLLRLNARLHDAVDGWWESTAMRRAVGYGLMIAFVGAVALIEASRQGWLPAPMDGLPTNHFYAFDVAFTIFLGVEIVGLVLGLAKSIANSLGKQFEVFSLILLRQSFKELVYFEEPIQWTLADDSARQAVQYVVADALGALLVFVTVGFYYRLQRHQSITDSPAELRRFVAAKKLVANALLATFVGLAAFAAVDFLQGGTAIAFFDTFYTVLIFSDVLIVLISFRYSTTYTVVFRNFGFAAATVMVRLALAGPHYVDALLGWGATLFAVGVTAAYNFVVPDVEGPASRDAADDIRTPERPAPEAQGEDEGRKETPIRRELS